MKNTRLIFQRSIWDGHIGHFMAASLSEWLSPVLSVLINILIIFPENTYITKSMSYLFLSLICFFSASGSTSMIFLVLL